MSAADSSVRRAQRRAAQSAQRAGQLAGDVDALSRRASQLAAEVSALSGRRDALDAYAAAGPLAGHVRFHEFAGLAAGGAVDSAIDAGPQALQRAARGVSAASASGSSAVITALVELASSAISWATVLSLGDGEASATLPVWEGRREGTTTLQHARGAAIRAVRGGGSEAASRVIAGMAPAGVRRGLARTPWDTIAAESGLTLATVTAAAAAADVPLGVRLADLDPTDRTALLRALAT